MSTPAIADLVIKACKFPYPFEALSVLRFCSGHGFNMSSVIEKVALTPLMLAIQSGSYELAKCMLSEFSIDTAVQVGGETALSLAEQKLPSERNRVNISNLGSLIDELTKPPQSSNSLLIFNVIDCLDADEFAIAIDIHLADGGSIDYTSDGDTLLMACVASGLYDHAKVLIQKGADPLTVVNFRTAQSVVENQLDDIKKDLARYPNPDDKEEAQRCQDFLDYLSSLSAHLRPDGSFFHGSFKDGKPFKGTLTKDGATVPGFFRDDKFIVSLD